MKRNQPMISNMPLKRQKTDEIRAPNILPGPSTSTSNFKYPVTNGKTGNQLKTYNKNPVPVPQKKAPIVADVWGDDDDLDEDQLVQATQNAEREIMASQINGTYVNCFRSNSEDFSCSTQMNKVENVAVVAPAKDGIPTQYQGYTEQIHDKLFADDDEDDFLVREIIDNGKESNSQKTVLPQPTTNGPLAQKKSFNFVPSSQVPQSSMYSDNQMSSQKENNQKDLWYSRKIRALNQQTERLRKISADTTEKLHTKEGEISSLRLELKTYKLHNEKLKLDKMKENENIKTQWTVEKRNLEEEIQKLKAENEFKTIEIFKLKQPAVTHKVKGDNRTEVMTLLKPHIFKVNYVECKSTPGMKLDKAIFEHSSDNWEISTKRNFCRLEKQLMIHLNSLQCKLSQIHLNFKTIGKISDEDIQQILSETPQVILAVEEFLAKEKSRNTFAVTSEEFQSNYLSENFQKHRVGKDGTEEGATIYQKGKIFPNEEGVLIRRIIAIYAILCENSPNFCEKISLELMDGKRSFVRILTGCLYVLDKSQKAFDYLGFVVSVASLLCSVGSNYSLMKSSSSIDDNLVDLFRGILICRPDHPLCISRMSTLLLRLSEDTKSFKLLNRFCVSCPTECFLLHDRFKLIGFTKDSCLMQLYGALLHTTFTQSANLNQVESKILHSITMQTLRFFRNCFQMEGNCVEFMKDLAEEQKTIRCNCYIKISHSIIVLLHLCLRHVGLTDEKFDQETTVVFKLGIVVLSDILTKCQRYKARDLSGVYRNRTILICNWLKIAMKEKLVSYKKVHEEALKGIELLQLDEINSKLSSQRIEPKKSFLQGSFDGFY